MAESMILEVLQVGPLGTNAYLVGCAASKEAAIIDPGDEGRRLCQAAQALGLSIKKVLITHGHVDHVGAVGDVKKLTGASVWMHEDDRPLYEACVAQARMFGIRATPPPALDGTLSDGDVVHIGQLRARVLATPGHSPGGVSFYFAEQAVVFSGDTLFNGGVGRTDLPGGSFEQLLRSIHNKLFSLPAQTRVLSGHGPSTTVAEERDTNPFLRDFPP